MSHEYNSPDYYAQTLTNFLESDEPKHRRERRYGIRHKAKHSKGMVYTQIAKVDITISFSMKGEIPYYYLEALSNKGISFQTSGKMNVERGPSGRISGNYWRDFYQQVILPAVKSAIE